MRHTFDIVLAAEWRVCALSTLQQLEETNKHLHKPDNLLQRLNGTHPGPVPVTCGAGFGRVATKWGEKEKRRRGGELESLYLCQYWG